MSNTKTILIAEDEPDLRSALVTVLTDAGYTVVECVDGQQALDALAKQLPDMALLDIHMPQASGIDVLRQIRESESGTNIPVTVLTATDTMDLISEVAATGGMHTDFLSKTEMSLQQVVDHVGSRLGLHG